MVVKCMALSQCSQSFMIVFIMMTKGMDLYNSCCCLFVHVRIDVKKKKKSV